MFSDEDETIEVYKAGAIKNIINDASAKNEYEIRVLTGKVEKLEHTLKKLIAILPPEMKLAFELTDDVPEKEEE